MSANLAENLKNNDIIGAPVPRIEGPEKANGRAGHRADTWSCKYSEAPCQGTKESLR